MRRRDAIRSIIGSAGLAATAGLSPFDALHAAPKSVALPPTDTLPDPLVFHDGKPVKNPHDWQRRRAEVLRTAEQQMYGVVPSARPPRIQVLEQNAPAFGGHALRTQVGLIFQAEQGSPIASLLLYTPRQVERAPAILGLNFWGNHTVTTDPGVLLNGNWVESGRSFVDLSCVVDHRATPACRGIDIRRWPIEQILQRGYAFATMYRGDIDPDVADGSVPGFRSAWPSLQNRGDNFSAIAAWAWSLSRGLDYLETNPHIDAKRVAAFGWSRLGKAAVWAGARDDRFAAVISHESGAGGAKLFRRGVGEDIHRLNTVFPHWYCKNFRAYNGMDKQLPFDQHLVLSAIAPRPLCIGSAVDDHNSDPEGEFTSGVLASKVYQFLGSSGLQSTTMPKPGEAIAGRVSYQIRSGGHDVLDSDWARYLDFLDANLR